eukprot:SAG31_NODE_24331_length_484_cov_0.722078_1_plen_26_part_10
MYVGVSSVTDGVGVGFTFAGGSSKKS